MSALAVLARVGERRIAFDAAEIEAVIDVGDVTPVPLAPPHIRGLTAVRSQVLTVVDVESALESRAAATPRRRALVVTRDKHSYALLVDAVEEVAAPQSASAQVPPMLGDGWAHAARGTVESDGRLSLSLDVAAIVTPRD